jgi:hypothetical protein
LVARFLHADDRLRDNFDGKITVRMCDAGFADAHEVGHRALLFGEIVYYRATAGP